MGLHCRCGCQSRLWPRRLGHCRSKVRRRGVKLKSPSRELVDDVWHFMFLYGMAVWTLGRKISNSALHLLVHKPPQAWLPACVVLGRAWDVFSKTADWR